jgi:hypothetical protein
VTVETATLTGSEVTLTFDPNLAASSDLVLEDQLQGSISGVDLGWNGSGTGFVNEVVCTVFTSTGICPSSDELAVLNVSSGGAVATREQAGETFSTAGGIASVTFATSQSEVWIFKNINSGSAPFSEIEQSYLVPEPTTSSMMSAGLLGLFFIGIGRRRRK